MTREAFQALTAQPPVLFDGATGSNLAAAGYPFHTCAEDWILAHPEVLILLQRQYRDAGSRIIYAPTFTANALSLGRHGHSADDVIPLNRDLVSLTRQAVGEDPLVAGSVTTMIPALDPQDPNSQEAMLSAYRQQIGAICDAGADLIVAETMMVKEEAIAALQACREVCQLPFICTMTLHPRGMGFYGDDGIELFRQLEALGADAVGLNCMEISPALVSLTARLRAAVSLPLLVKPNAGIPDKQAAYPVDPAAFATLMVDIYKAGAMLLGGCCGTTPAYIAALRNALQDITP